MAPYAILGWGSLIWETGDLQLKGSWKEDGPTLPLEFSRISTTREGALTLVIDPAHGELNGVQFASSKRRRLEDVISDLQRREGTVVKRIGFVDLDSGDQRCNVHPPAAEEIRVWATEEGFSGVVWTDLPSNFADKRGIPFTIDAAVAYLNGLQGSALAQAQRYVRNAPATIQTPLRRRLSELDWSS